MDKNLAPLQSAAFLTVSEFELQQDLKHRTCLFIADNWISYHLKIGKKWIVVT